MITEGYLARHYGGRRGGRDVALLDVAQDYALEFLARRGFFDLGLTLKGETALRKFRIGNQGRFSTDLDFAVTEATVGELVFTELDGVSVHEVRFDVEVLDEVRRGRLHIETPLGRPQVDARIEIRIRAPWLRPEIIPPIPLAVHDGYEFQPRAMPVMRLEESLAEKLAALRRRRLARDLFDLAWFARRPFDTDLVRRLTYLKVFTDVVHDGLGDRPFDSHREILGLRPSAFEAEDIGLLIGQVDISGWLEAVQERFVFLTHADELGRTLARCNPRDQQVALVAIGELGRR